MGYVRTGSVPSIAAGLTVGILVSIELCISYRYRLELNVQQYLIGGYRIQNRLTYGTELALLASVVLAGSSIPRAIRSQKPLPAGLSVLATYGLYTFGKAWQAKK